MSAKPTPGRMTAETTRGVTVFLIGMRINRWWALRDWLPVFTAMPRMLRELATDPDSGLLGYRLVLGPLRNITVVQYWDSHEKLLAYASARDKRHRPAWQAFNQRIGRGKGRVGIWHETFVVPRGAHESIYLNVPPTGLGAATGTVPVGRRGEYAAHRLQLDRG